MRALLSTPHLVERRWLDDRLDALLADEGCRIVLVTGEPGSGKSVLLAGLASRDPESLRYFLRRDSVRAHRSDDVHSFLESVGHQLAARHEALFAPEDIAVEVVQSVQRVAPGARVVGIRAEQVLASPFRRTALRVRQEVGDAEGELTGIDVDRLVLDLRALDWRDVQHLALLGPLSVLASTQPDTRVLLLVDALDEARGGLVDWLTACPDLPPVLRVVVTSREADFLPLLRQRQAHQLRELRLDSFAEESSGDVTGYLEAAVTAVDLPGGQGERAALLNRWVTAAEGNFLYAGTIVRALQDAASRHELETVSALGAPGTVPTDVQELYAVLVRRLRASLRERFVRLPSGGSAPVWDEVYAPVLGVLAVAWQPVTAAEIAALADLEVPVRLVREALRDMLPFLDVHEATHRFHHSTVAEFLTRAETERDAPECFLDAEEWHRTAGAASARALIDRAPSVLRVYGTRHAAAHLLAAATSGSAGDEGDQLLSRVSTHLPALQDRIEAAGEGGVDLVADELLQASRVVVAERALVAGLARLVDRQRHHLRQWRRAPNALFVAQQLHNEAAELGLQELAGALASPLGDADGVLRTVLSAGSDSSRLQRTVLVGRSLRGLAALDADTVATAGDDGVLRVFAASTGQLLAAEQVASSPVHAVAWSQRHGLVWGSADGTVGSWHPGERDGATGAWQPSSRPVRSLPTVACVRGDDGTDEGLVDGHVLLTSLHRQQPRWLLLQPGSVEAIAVRREDGEVAVGTGQGDVLVVHPSFTEFAAGYPLHRKAVTGLHFGSHAITSCSHDGTIRRTDLSTDTLVDAAPCAYTGLAGDESGRLAAARWDGGLDVLLPDGNLLRGAPLGRPATAVAAGPDGRLFVGFLDRRVWVLGADLTAEATLRGHGEEVCALAGLSPDTLVSASTDGTLRVWSLARNVPSSRPRGHDGPVSSLVFADDVLVSGSADGSVRRWRVSDGSQDARNAQHGQVWGLCHLGDGVVAASTQSGAVLLLHPSGAGAVSRGHSGEARACTVLADGRLVSVDDSGSLLLWERRFGRGWTGRALPPAGLVSAAALAPLGRRLVAVAPGGDDGDVVLVDVDDGQVRRLRGHAGPVFAVSAGPGGTLLSGSHDGTARVWDPVSGQTLCVYEEHAADVSALAALRDDLVVSGSGDSTVRVWRSRSGETVALAGLSQPVDCLAVDAVGNHVAVGHANGDLSVLATRVPA